MQKLILILAVIVKISVANAQTIINTGLKSVLDSIYTEDQRYRQLLFSGELKTRADSLSKLFKVEPSQLQGYLMVAMQKADSLNMLAIDKIIKQYGYPGKSLVGEPANEAAFFVIQHSAKIDNYLPLVKKAAQKKELPFKFYAMMLDRSLMYNGKPQVYGTQGQGFQVLNPTTGEKEFKMIIWPVKKPGTVNKRRKKAGFTDSIEENAKRLGIVYTVLTLAEIKKMQGK